MGRPRHAFVYLASQSPRRAQLLGQLGARHVLLLPDPDEDAEGLEAVVSGESPATYVQRVTRLKLAAAVQRLKRRRLDIAPILCADTTVSLGQRILGKPASPEEALEMLAALSGRAHRVHTSLAVARPHGRGWRVEPALSQSRVVFGAVSPSDLKAYVASGEPMGKAGAYAIQGAAQGFIESIQGSYSGIMGLPLFETRRLLVQAGVALGDST